ncbi:MAG: hypothetical protein J6T54_12520 [Fibrobacter sp.]|nr:hypothetical protein [Fibrobacter sp.]
MKRIVKRQAILSALKKGHRISALDAWNIARTFCLAEIIRDLKKIGYKFDTRYVVENGCRFATYKLKK